MPYRKHLSTDKKLAAMFSQQGKVDLIIRDHLHLELCASILSQQLSTKVARVLRVRFENLFSSPTPSAKAILAMPHEKLRTIGLSNAKAAYMHNVCTFFIANKLTDKKLMQMGDEAIIDLLTQIKGIGRWTVEMILMFSMGREDVFAVDDLGIQKAMCKLYKISSADKKKMKVRMMKIAEKWKPYRSYACIHLWRSLD